MQRSRPDSVVRLPLIEDYLRRQGQTTAVERFAARHDADPSMGGRPVYRDLIPLERPLPGQQYAFQVDLDRCTGCQACVTGCHRMNGLDEAEAETWRSVGVLRGGAADAPVQMSVTAACHHCVDPACMNGCPVGAYEKDAVTGIVRHLDDQCIGCQYCLLTCPYEVPQLNQRLGIVRKCDMCSGRLDAGEAPACVQACPNEAISIQVVDKAQVAAGARTGALVPGAPPSSLTAPTTRYIARRPPAADLLPANFHDVRPAKGHPPLTVMLVLTQWSAGAFALDFALGGGRAWGGSAGSGGARVRGLLGAALVGVLALAASTLHLGRPRHALRALIGLRTSWLSREVLAFGLFTPLAAGYAASSWWSGTGGVLPPALDWVTSRCAGGLVAVLGLAGVSCSAMVYAVTGKGMWSLRRVGFRFASTTALLGACATLASLLVGDGGPAASPPAGARALALGVAAFGLAKLGWEIVALGRHRVGPAFSARERTAVLLRGPLRTLWRARLIASAAGSVLLPIVLAGWMTAIPSRRLRAALGIASLILSLGAELAERTLFFRAVSGSRMPGQGP
jgi:formate dehydrogenase iron-sulfur subunit